jgi:hypothetical protein
MSLRSTSLSFQAFVGMTVALEVSCEITSGTSPLVSPEMIFCSSGANGIRL